MSIELLLLPFQLPFMQQALIIAVLVAAPLSMLSPFLVLKGWSLMGDAVSHAVLPGIVLAYMVGLPLGLGAFAAGMACALATGYIKEHSRIKEDTAMGVVFSGMFGLGIVLYVWAQPEVHLDHILFGDMLGSTWGDIAESGAIAALAMTLLVVFGRDLLLHAFDAQHARAIGLPVRLLHYGLLAILSLAIVGALKAVGIILAIALLIMPGAIAHLSARRFEAMVLSSLGIGVFSSVAGVYASFFIDSAPAPTIVVVMTVLFLLAFVRSEWRLAGTQRKARDRAGRRQAGTSPLA